MKRPKSPLEKAGMVVLACAAACALVPDLVVVLAAIVHPIRDEPAVANRIQTVAFYGVILALFVEASAHRHRKPPARNVGHEYGFTVAAGEGAKYKPGAWLQVDDEYVEVVQVQGDTLIVRSDR